MKTSNLSADNFKKILDLDGSTSENSGTNYKQPAKNLTIITFKTTGKRYFRTNDWKVI